MKRVLSFFVASFTSILLIIYVLGADDIKGKPVAGLLAVTTAFWAVFYTSKKPQ
jgi:hypothetical protein